ncbi:MAG: hypothetical protein KC518_05725 [Candidatus Cloacimonetes bacterium]|nr:hypothetical protein [Candidatus Cloacimonadota bacterium]
MNARTPRTLFRLLAALLLFVGCARTPLPGIDQELRRLERPVLLADLEQTSRELLGEAVSDRARLALVPGMQGQALPHADGWLVTLEREDRLWFCWLGAGKTSGRAELLASGRQVRLLDFSDSRALVWEEDNSSPARNRLVEVRPGGGREILSEDLPDRLRLDSEGKQLLQASGESSAPFVEAEGSWHLEQTRPILRHGAGWSLGKAEDAETPYRSLCRFVAAARSGAWSKAKREVVLERLLALPGGGYSRELAASLRLSAPALLEKNRPLKAPSQGELRRFQDLAGHAAWRVELQVFQDSRGRSQWKLVRLQTVEKP